MLFLLCAFALCVAACLLSSLLRASTSFDKKSAGTIRIVQPFEDHAAQQQRSPDDLPPSHPVSRHMQKVQTLADLESWAGRDLAAAATDTGGSMDNTQKASKYATIYSQWGPNMGVSA